jgi:hypothetical protein
MSTVVAVARRRRPASSTTSNAGRRRYRGRQEEHHGQPAEDALGDHGDECGGAKALHPPPRIGNAKPHGEHDG